MDFHPVAKIIVKDRVRKDFGDLQGLADSIAEIGLLQPIGITKDSELVFGERRLRAVRDVLGWPEIAAREVNLEAIVLGEFAENEMRKDFTPSERVEIGRKIETWLGNRQGQRTDLELVQNFAQVAGEKTRDVAADRAGFGNAETYRQAKKVVEHGIEEIVEAMDSGTISISAAASIADAPPEFQKKVAEAINNGAKSGRDAIRLARRAEVTETSELPTGKYRVIYADPPWKYGDGLTANYGAAEYHYPPQTITELCEKFPVVEMAQDDAVLFMWVTSPLLEECFAVIKAWGFKYKASFVWDKVKHNMGHYNSVRHEFLLVCTRGSCLPDVGTLLDSVQSVERSDRHSEKPKLFREIINQLYPHGNRIELFARSKTEGWETYGNQLR